MLRILVDNQEFAASCTFALSNSDSCDLFLSFFVHIFISTASRNIAQSHGQVYSTACDEYSFIQLPHSASRRIAIRPPRRADKDASRRCRLYDRLSRPRELGRCRTGFAVYLGDTEVVAAHCRMRQCHRIIAVQRLFRAFVARASQPVSRASALEATRH